MAINKINPDLKTKKSITSKRGKIQNLQVKISLIAYAIIPISLSIRFQRL